jgi:hypothetical protein
MSYLWDRFIEHPAARKIADSIRNEPDKWAFGPTGRHTLDYKDSGLQIWVANGYSFCAIYNPESVALGVIGRLRVWRAAGQWIRRYDPPEPEAKTFRRRSKEIVDMLDTEQSAAPQEPKKLKD